MAAPVARPPLPDAQLERAVEIATAALENHAWDRIAVSFNGGKDSVATLDVVRRAVERYNAHHAAAPSPTGDAPAPAPRTLSDLRCFVFDPDGSEFPEVAAFRAEVAKSHGLDVYHVPRGVSMRQGLWELHEKWQLEVALLGIRHSDPSAAWLKSPIAPCTAGWPPVTLYCPIYEWGYGELWDYTLNTGLSVCDVYRRGYTSRGDRHRTVPHPALRVESTVGGANGDVQFRPAWELTDGSLERHNRSEGPPSATSSEAGDTGSRL